MRYRIFEELLLLWFFFSHLSRIRLYTLQLLKWNWTQSCCVSNTTPFVSWLKLAMIITTTQWLTTWPVWMMAKQGIWVCHSMSCPRNPLALIFSSTFAFHKEFVASSCIFPLALCCNASVVASCSSDALYLCFMVAGAGGGGGGVVGSK